MVEIDAINEIQKTVVDAISKLFEEQGHYMTGALIEKLEWAVKSESDKIVMELYMNKYGIYINNGVKASNIPFSQPSGRGGRSKYIGALQNYVQRRMGLSEKKSLSVAFAIAQTHKKEGMPTKASSRFSQSGKRTGFLDEAVQNSGSIVEDQLSKLYQKMFELKLGNILVERIKLLNKIK